MSDRRYPRPRSPPLYNPGRSSLPVLNYGAPSELHAVPTRREIIATPRSSNDRVNAAGPVVTTYKIKPEAPSRGSSVRAGSRSRRSTLDGAPRPVIVTTHEPRFPSMQSGSARPSSPLHNPYRSSDEGDYYAIPSSSGRHRGHSRQAYSATMDNADMHKSSRDYGSGRSMAPPSGRERLSYPRSRRFPDTPVDDYGDDGFAYANPKDLVEYDLNRSARYPNSRRDSFEGSRGARPSSITGYADIMPRSYDNRERGPPPSMRGFDKLPPRGYDAPSSRAPPGPEPIPRSRPDPYDEPPRSSRRPVSVYQEPERHRRDEYYDPRDDDQRERREKPRRPDHYDDVPDKRGYGGRSDRNDKDDYDRRRDYDRHDYDKKDDHEDRHERKRDLIATGLSLAGAALGINTAKNAFDDDRDDRDEPRRRKDSDEELRRRRDPRDERDSVDLAGRDPKERHVSRDDRGSGDFGRDQKGRNSPREDRGEYSDRGDRGHDRHGSRDDRDVRDGAGEPREHRRHRSDSKTSPPGSRDDSSASDEAGGRRHRKAREGGATPFNPRDTMDLRALKDALNKQNAPATTSEGKDAKSVGTENESAGRDDRDRRDVGRDRSGSENSQDRKAPPRVVSPPREAAKGAEEKPPVKGILRPPREKFPEDPMAVREGVAPLKDAKKEGIPPDARWTKISRKLVNPEALEAGKERFEARDDFVIVLRVLTKEEVQGYAAITQQIRARRQEEDEREEEEERHRQRRERHQRHRQQRHRYEDEHAADEHDREYRRHRRERERDSHSESDTTEDDDAGARNNTSSNSNSNQDPPPKMIDAAPKSRKIAFDEGTGSKLNQILPGIGPDSSLKEDPALKGVYSGYVRNPPVAAAAAGGAGRKDRD